MIAWLQTQREFELRRAAAGDYVISARRRALLRKTDAAPRTCAPTLQIGPEGIARLRCRRHWPVSAIRLVRTFVAEERRRISGILSIGSRGLTLTTASNELWIVQTDRPADELIGDSVTVEGTVTGFDRIRADRIGAN
ncbi:DUF5818 domain-containing protein [Novosphingobium jiangmenense]|uniref:DUF5818 domain-containing protein n=1 Tax=Novosphingobium jiangmenense TaxID=2791981 RepID=UPI001FED0FE5|nr:DUF5818 domain-containing protein [Novosphingobium jiangmenense]